MIPWRVQQGLERASLWAAGIRKPLRSVRVSHQKPALWIAAVGDIALSGRVEKAVLSNGPEAVLGPIAPLLAGCSVRTGNLECALTNASNHGAAVGSLMKAPPAAAALLKFGKFDVVNLANNHMLDYGTAGLTETLQVLNENGIRYCGVTDRGGQKPAIVHADGVTVGFLGYCDEARWVPQSETPQPAFASDDRLMFEQIRALRRHANIVVLQLHWGYEFALYPLLTHRDRARRFAEHGADIVLCHHGHVPMGIERWRGSIIAHGLGNFVFDLGSYLRTGHAWTDRSVALRIGVHSGGVTEVRLAPYIMRGVTVVPATGAACRQILGAMRVISERLQDTEFLKRLERDRTYREAIRIARTFESAGSRTNPETIERARLLQMPKYQHLLDNLGRYSDKGAKGAAMLASVARAAGDPAALAEALRATTNGSGGISTALMSEARLPAAAPGRTP